MSIRTVGIEGDDGGTSVERSRDFYIFIEEDEINVPITLSVFRDKTFSFIALMQRFLPYNVCTALFAIQRLHIIQFFV